MRYVRNPSHASPSRSWPVCYVTSCVSMSLPPTASFEIKSINALWIPLHVFSSVISIERSRAHEFATWRQFASWRVFIVTWNVEILNLMEQLCDKHCRSLSFEYVVGMQIRAPWLASHYRSDVQWTSILRRRIFDYNAECRIVPILLQGEFSK